LTPNFSYIRSSLYSRHLQRFKSVLQKLFVALAFKKCAPNELPGVAGTFGSGGQISRWPSLGIALIAAFRSGIVWGCCHTLKVSPQIKIWGVQVRWMQRPLQVTPAADQSVRETLL